MNVVHFGYSDLAGGGNIAAYRIHRSLVDAGVASTMVVARKLSSDSTVVVEGLYRFDIWRRILFRVEKEIKQLRFGRSARPLTIDLLGANVAKIAKKRKADVINLHWTHNGFATLKSIGAAEQPVVWTLHDMVAFTGGCHYSEGCRNFETQCGNCKLLGERAGENDASRQLLLFKERHLSRTPSTIVAPSSWMQQQVKRSSIFSKRACYRVGYCLEDHWFEEPDSVALRSIHKIPNESLTLMFASNSGSADKRKGFDLLQDAISKLKQQIGSLPIIVLVVGGERDEHVGGEIQDGIRFINLGRVSSEREMRNIYASTDVFVAPSREDNLPLVAIESLASGTPVVAFDIGGFPDLVPDQTMGYLATPFQPESLATGILETARNNNVARRLLIRKRAKDTYGASRIAAEYMEVYRATCQNSLGASIHA